MFKDLKKIGRIVSTHGLKGEMKFKLNDKLEITSKIKGEQFFLESPSKEFDVFEVEKNYFINKKNIIVFKEIKTIDDAHKLVNSIVYVKLNSNYIEEKFTYVGFKWIYKSNLFGEVIDEMFNGAQVLIKINFEESKIWVPCVDFYVEKTDISKKEIFLKELDLLK